MEYYDFTTDMILIGEILIIVFLSFLTFLFFAIWIYKDCKLRGESPLLWLLLLFFVSKFLGLIIYLIVRQEKRKKCEHCGYLMSITAKYCENCGIETQNSSNILAKEKSNRKFIIAGITSFCLIIVSAIITIISCIVIESSFSIFSYDLTANTKIVNKGFETFSKENKTNTSWDLSVISATKGFVYENQMEITKPEQQILYLDAICELKKNDGNLMLWLVQGDVVESIDVTNLGKTLEYPLNKFKEGKIFVRLQINDVKNVKSNIYIK